MSSDYDLSDAGDKLHKAEAWKLDFYNDVVSSWRSSAPSVIISYDHPTERMPIVDQISRAQKLIFKDNNYLKEILIKTRNSRSEIVKNKINYR